MMMTTLLVICFDKSVHCNLIFRVAFANGGDRTSSNIPEIPVAEQLGVHLIWGVGGGKVQSSSDLVDGLVGTNVRMYKEK